MKQCSTERRNEMNKAVIGRKLLKLRGNKSREQVAFELGISFSALVSYETGVRVPKDEIKLKNC